MGGLVIGSQIAAGRALANVTQRQLAQAAGVHVNSIRYLERQKRITARYSSERIENAMSALGVTFFRDPTPGVRIDAG